MDVHADLPVASNLYMENLKLLFGDVLVELPPSTVPRTHPYHPYLVIQNL